MKKLLCAGLLLILLALGSCRAILPERTRYRMTLEVETPAGLRTGQTVREQINYGSFPLLPGGATDHVEKAGDALAVDLPRGVLFVTLDNSYLDEALRFGTVTPHFRGAGDESADVDGLVRRFRRTGATASITPEQLRGAGFRFLVLMRFRDLADPATGERLDPADLSAAFGPGVRIRKITLVPTKDPVSTDIEQRLPWLSKPGRYQPEPNHPVDGLIVSMIDSLSSRH